MSKCQTCGLPTIPYSDRCVTHYTEVVNRLLKGEKVAVVVEKFDEADLVSALVNLSYRKPDATRLTKMAIDAGMITLEDALRYALRQK